ncbi:DNA or RNA helicase of superfamily II [bacterium]|nr:DNA or RNA helicase of superfamily II [bacterium]
MPSESTQISGVAASCPVCGNSNECAVAGNSSIQNCWCKTVAVSSEALARIRAKYPVCSCLCPACLEGEIGSN